MVIDHQHVLNAVDGRAKARLNGIWDQLEADPDVRAVVITGAGTRAFCAGADMSSSAVDKTGLEFWAGLDPNGFGGLSLRHRPGYSGDRPGQRLRPGRRYGDGARSRTL